LFGRDKGLNERLVPIDLRIRSGAVLRLGVQFIGVDGQVFIRKFAILQMVV
jgi:hypothetical protein